MTPEKYNQYEPKLNVKGDRFQKFDHVPNRKLLWHGTNIAVIVAILKGGLRIMPHSGGRLGAGLYFASENGKSSWYGMQTTLYCRQNIDNALLSPF